MELTEILQMITLTTIILVFIYAIFLIVRISHLQQLFLLWNEKLRMFIEDKKENTIIGKTIVCDYYSEYYLTEIKKYLFKMKLWKEKDFIEDLLLHYDVNKYYDEKENDNSV